MKFLKLTRFYSDVDESMYVNMELVETIMSKTDNEGGQVVGSIIGMQSMGDDPGIVVKESPEEIMKLLYWEDLDGQA